MYISMIKQSPENIVTFSKCQTEILRNFKLHIPVEPDFVADTRKWAFDLQYTR